MRIAAIVLCLFVEASSNAQTAAPGDLINVGLINEFFFGERAIADVRSADGALKFEPDLNDRGFGSGAVEVLFAPDGNIYMAHPFHILIVGADFKSVGGLSANDVYGVIDLTMDGAQTLYVLTAQGGIIRFTKEGIALPTMTVPGFLRSGDLSLDGCVLNYVEFDRPALKRFDLCKGVALPDTPLTMPPCGPSKIRVAPDGSIFIATCSSVLHVTVGGVRSFPLPVLGDGDRTLAISQEGTTLWTGGNAGLLQVDVRTGLVLRHIPFTSAPLSPFYWGTAIYGVPRAAAHAALVNVPALSVLTLAGLALAMAVVAVARITS
jgi:hypothetical protein